ncbi:MAG: aminotransferase class I/II-fold pyridoxal phosphate-dependent enzyme [Eubacterium sp.]|nr:aminotransferase class I/II-fold pyridoxal phosphate-dependent enzyme [Eubacterium sp.]
MFDWLEFDQKTQKGFEEQMEQVKEVMARYIEKNSQIRELPIFDKPDQETLDKIIGWDIPAKGREVRDISDELIDNVFEKAMVLQHPRFFSFVSTAVSPYSIAGSLLSDIYNVNAGSWELAPGAGLIEEKLIKWMGGLAGYDGDNIGGVFLSGGSMANMSALVAARDSRLSPEEFPEGVVYFSDQTHSSVEKGLRIIGFREDQVVKIPTDDEFKVRVDLMEEAIERDLAAGKKPFAIVGNLGTTNTGTIDPLEKLGEMAKKYDLWFHVDGAFGGSILVSPIRRNLAKGISMSDSFSWDTHKWLMQVYSCSSLIVKDKSNLFKSFTEHPEYLADVSSSEHGDGWDLGPEMSRPARAIKLWYTLQATGTDLLEELIEYSFYNASLVEKELSKRPNWKIISHSSCGTVNFRYEPEGMSEEDVDVLTDRISKAIIGSGFAFIVTTTLKGHKTLRMCTINANTTEEDIRKTVELLDELAKRESNALNG